MIGYDGIYDALYNLRALKTLKLNALIVTRVPTLQNHPKLVCVLWADSEVKEEICARSQRSDYDHVTMINDHDVAPFSPSLTSS